MNRSLKLSILLALALGSTQAAAVELGQAHIKSALGQPLLVEIPVTHGTPAELQSLSAELAPNDAFVKAGSQRPAIPLQFSVVDDNGHKVIRVTSSSPVDDPYLDLLVEVNSSTGSNVREFAILLDPPTKVTQAASSAPSRRRAPASSASSSNETAAAPSRRSSVPARNAAGAAPEVKNGQFGPVEKGATLSHIAAEVAPTGVDTNQMMLALKSANPDAFYRDNINALKAGAILRVPSRDDAVATAVAAAAATVRQQNADWRNGTTTPVAVAAGGTRENATVAPTANSNADRLALVPPGSEGQAAGGTNGKGGANAAVRQELQRSQETLASLQQQSSELKSRLKDLEDINGKNQRLLSLKDNEIADLQKQLADARKAAGKPAAPAATPAPAPAPAPEVASKPVAPVAAPAPAPAPAMATAASAPKPAAAASAPHNVVTTPLNAPAKPKPVAQPHHVPTPAPEEQPWYMETWAWAAGAAVVVLGLVGLLLSRRGKSGAKPPKSTAPVKGGSLADRFGTADEGEAHAGSDPDQDELLDQLAEQPDDIGLHLELVSLYYTRRDVEHFEAAAEAMHAHITDPDQPEWQDVVHMGRDLAPGHPLFAEPGADATTMREPAHHFDLDSYSNSPASEPVAPSPARSPAAQPSKVSEYHFDFDLTPHHPEALSRAAAPAPAPAAAVKEAEEEEPISTWKFDESLDAPQTHTEHAEHTDHDNFGELHDDPVDTKLDLARAYLDMGDPDGARAMLEEVMHEGSQMQREVAKQLLDKIS